jgi:transposase
MALQLLEHSKKAGEKIYRYYSIAEPYREDGKNKKRVLAHLGSLPLEQVEKIRQTLRVHNDPGLQWMDPEAIECTGTWSYLELAVFHQLWLSLKLSKVISSSEADIELEKLLEILVLNRTSEPVSKSGIVRWYPTTALESILEVPVSLMNESRVYRSLPSIDSQQEKIENHLFQTLIAKKDPKLQSLYFYDLTSSYFEGDGVEIAAFSEHSKDHRPDRLQVVLGLLINEEGLPFSWDIFKGNQGDAPTLVTQLKKFKKRFGVENALLVFDRGFLSHDNLERVEAEGYQYLTGLRAPAIKDLFLIHPQKWLSQINTETAEKTVLKEKKWKRFDETGFYSELGEINHRKTVLLFDTDRYKLAVLSRQKRIDSFKEWVGKHNLWLQEFKKDAAREAIQKDVDEQIQKRKLETYVSYELHEFKTENETFKRRKNNPFPSQGYMRKVSSLQIVVIENNHDQLDGVFALITSPKCKLTAEEMLLAYREKYLIEHAFREMKQALKLRPWFVYKMEHVRAHYTICVLAYLLEKILDLKLESSGLKNEGWTLGRLKEELSQTRLVEITLAGRDPRRKLQKVPAALSAVLKKLGLASALKISP